MHGSILTTAPETLPAKHETSPFKAGDRVRHPRFGAGSILDLNGANVLVRFEKSGQKRVRADFLRPA